MESCSFYKLAYCRLSFHMLFDLGRLIGMSKGHGRYMKKALSLWHQRNFSTAFPQHYSPKRTSARDRIPRPPEGLIAFPSDGNFQTCKLVTFNTQILSSLYTINFQSSQKLGLKKLQLFEWKNQDYHLSYQILTWIIL